MKWPRSITLVRHAESIYNILREKKAKDPLYQEFKRAFEEDFQSAKTLLLARQMQETYALGVSDYDTPVTDDGYHVARVMGEYLSQQHACPDVVLYSPYLRVRQTVVAAGEGWKGLPVIKAISDDRIREQEHGLALLYNDWRIFHVFHPEQKYLWNLLGPYWYQYPQGESVSMVRDRIRLFTDMLIREYAGMDVLIFSHHLTILSIRANFERLTPEQFIHLDENEKPINCGVTRYECNPHRGKDGKLELCFYNKRAGDI